MGPLRAKREEKKKRKKKKKKKKRERREIFWPRVENFVYMEGAHSERTRPFRERLVRCVDYGRTQTQILHYVMIMSWINSGIIFT